MTNSDNLYGVWNKQTIIISQVMHDGSTAPKVFSSIEEAKTYIFTAEALAIYDDTATELQWALVNEGSGNTALKKTFGFGTKGAGVDPADDWAEQYNTRKQPLLDSGTWFKSYEDRDFLATHSSEHLF